jgi:hypothetical protein
MDRYPISDGDYSYDSFYAHDTPEETAVTNLVEPINVYVGRETVRAIVALANGYAPVQPSLGLAGESTELQVYPRAHVYGSERAIQKASPGLFVARFGRSPRYAQLEWVL